MKHVLHLFLVAALFAAFPSRALPHAGDLISTTYAECESPEQEVAYVARYWIDSDGVRHLEPIPFGYSLTGGDPVVLVATEGLAQSVPEDGCNCTAEYFETTWTDTNGLEHRVRTHRRVNEPRQPWARRHQGDVEVLLTLYPPRPQESWAGSTCATPNSTGEAALLELLESGDLMVRNMPRAQVGLLLRSPFQASQPVPFGEGFICLHPLHLTHETAFVPDSLGTRVIVPQGEGYYQAVFRDWSPRIANTTSVASLVAAP